ncbi:VQ domain-containing protein [Cephalotus follicularis]|uniref:VQ domain-containing protein n=1 Tax=Cephalotus follicularis TaxID=3775 RepID=A0A1Q3CBN4_CEPFO|nr:VQ domain-containing protein [Cephalotus follicularis]
MDSSEFPIRSPRRELQGPRPTPLKVRKDSHKIKKPPIAPHLPSQQQQQEQQQAQLRPPVIIYTVSPKVIHTNPNDFMTLVQRLTGSSSRTCSSSSSSITSSQLNDYDCGAISPAARYASIEKIKSPIEGKKQLQQQRNEDTIGFVEGIDMSQVMGRQSLFPGILSPGPSSLPTISPNFFSPAYDPNLVSFFHDLSPVLHGNRNFMEGSFMPSPSSIVSPLISSPTPAMDLFNNFFDF